MIFGSILIKSYFNWLALRAGYRYFGPGSEPWVEITLPLLDGSNDYIEFYIKRNSSYSYTVSEGGQIMEGIAADDVAKKKDEILITCKFAESGFYFNENELLVDVREETFPEIIDRLVELLRECK